ncbi:MAG TPA: glycerate kinase [Pseudonocardiaceae bacterium]|nr:glycerate kinase [Pseudonocardiaceae bacterium]
MRVLIAPDCFGGTLTAVQAAEAIGRGWQRAAPGDELVLRPLADGGPGFVAVLHAALGGTVHTSQVTGPVGEPVLAHWLDHERTGYVESAQACGLHLVPPERRDARTATSRGVGELLAEVRAGGLQKAVVGLGGSASSDGGAGALAALGAVAVDAEGQPLPDGGAALVRCARLAGRAELAGLRLVAAADVTNPLLGPHGAAHVFGPQKGAGPDQVHELEVALARWADVLEAATGRAVREVPAAGAAGGLGAALLALGAERISGAQLIAACTGLDTALDAAELVVTGEGSFDWQSLRGKLITALAEGAAGRGLACIVLAGQVSVGRREAAAVGVAAMYAAAELAGSVAAALADPVGTLEAVAEQAARQWGGGR